MNRIRNKILIVLFLGAIVLGLTRLMPDPTANWKTYNYGDGAFSFKYPPGWRITSEGKDCTSNFRPTVLSSNKSFSWIDICTAYGSPTKEIFAEREVRASPHLRETSRETFTIEGRPALRQMFESKDSDNKTGQKYIHLFIEEIPSSKTSAKRTLRVYAPTDSKDVQTVLTALSSFKFTKSALKEGTVEDGCKTTGCFDEVCSDKEVTQACMWKDKYSCYSSLGRCERQSDGKCGWNQTLELKSCLSGHQD